MAIYYCTDTQITDLLPTLTSTDLSSEAYRQAKLQLPAKAWIDSVYPNLAPFPAVSAAVGYKINSATHAAGDETVPIDGGSGLVVAGDFFQVEGHNSLYKVITPTNSTTTSNVTYTWVETYRSGVEETTTGALAEFLDNTEIYFGCPVIISQAAMWYARGLAYQILRNSPVGDEAKASFEIAKNLLQIGPDGIARTRPWIYRYDAWDASSEDNPPTASWVNLVR